MPTLYSFLKLVIVAVIFNLVACANSNVKTLTIASKEGTEIYEIETETIASDTDYENSKLKSKSKELCPRGFNILNQRVFREFGVESVIPDDSPKLLQWRIQCTERADLDFSIFGKF